MIVRKMFVASFAVFAGWHLAGTAHAQATDPTMEPAQPPPMVQPMGRGAKWQIALETDPNDLKVFRQQNASLPPPKDGEDRVVFLGDSITANWQNSFRTLFPGKPYVGRGYTSETTQQMLIRFRPDVIALKPKAVVILAGTNDIAGNTGRTTQEMIQDNLISMVDLAEVNKIKVVMLSVLPADRYWWQPSITDAATRIVDLNKWIKAYAETRPNEMIYVDAHTPMTDEKGAMKRQYSGDGVHPNAQGYQLISPLTEAAIQKILGKSN